MSEIAPNFDVFGPPNFRGGRGLTNVCPNYINLVTVDLVAKFGDDRSSDLGYLLLCSEKKKKERSKLHCGA